MRSQQQKKPAKLGQIRIIAGTYRGRKLPVLAQEGLRPTSDRTKETLFNWLQSDIHNARCLDLFAGSGALGFEALSRGAQHATMVEVQAQATKLLQDNASTLKCREKCTIIHASALALTSNIQAEPFDIVFIDPPFGQGLVIPALENLLQHNLINSHTLLYIEHEQTLTTGTLRSTAFQLKALKQQKAGQCTFGLYTLIPYQG